MEIYVKKMSDFYIFSFSQVQTQQLVTSPIRSHRLFNTNT